MSPRYALAHKHKHKHYHASGSTWPCYIGNAFIMHPSNLRTLLKKSWNLYEFVFREPSGSECFKPQKAGLSDLWPIFFLSFESLAQGQWFKDMGQKKEPGAFNDASCYRSLAVTQITTRAWKVITLDVTIWWLLHQLVYIACKLCIKLLTRLAWESGRKDRVMFIQFGISMRLW